MRPTRILPSARPSRWLRVGSRRARPFQSTTDGFTLLELILALTLLILVLTTSYRLIVDALQSEQKLDELTIPEKVGEGILSIFRRDLGGTFFRNMGRRVFLLDDGGEGEGARDELRFLTTVEPTPIEDQSNLSEGGFLKLRTITGVGYFLQTSRAADGLESFTLFRREIVEFTEAEDPLESPGINYELYNKVKYLSIEAFDGWEWFSVWDSESRIFEEESSALADEEDGAIARVSDPRATPGALADAPGVNPDDPRQSALELLPPAAVPVAVRVELGIYVVSRDRVLKNADGLPLVRTFATIIPILTAQRLPILADDLAGALEGEAAAEGAPAATQGAGGAALEGGRAFRGGAGRRGGGASGGSRQPGRTDRLRRGNSPR
jgi:hypothetical protein